MSSSRSPLRLLRGGAAATIATAVALSGHVIGGGDMPGWLGVLVPWWLSVAACTVLAGSRFSPARMSAAVLTSQVLFHGLFMAGTVTDSAVVLQAPPGKSLDHHAHLMGGTAASSAASSAGSSAGSSAASHAAHTPTGGATGSSDASVHTTHSMLEHALGGVGGWPMIIGHLAAAVVTIVLLQRGETMLFRCFGLARTLLAFLRPVRVVVPTFVLPAPRRVGPSTARVRRVRRAVLSPQLRRGPPVVLAA
ncbi:hypothetical protein ACXET9_12545 [Brachybacterium sp. DNPG3]